MSFCLTCHTAVPSAVELADLISPQLEKGVLCVNQGRINIWSPNGIHMFLNLCLGLLAYMFSGKRLEAWKGGRF